MAKLIDHAYLKAVEVLKKNSTTFGFKASADYYNSVWARDGVITILGAILVGDKTLLETSRKTLETLKKHQTSLGQIPNAFFLDKKTPTYYAMDANPWWIIGVERYFARIRKNNPSAAREFLNEFWPSIKKASEWLKYQIKDQSGLIDSPEAADWMDSSIGRRGKVFYINCLYYGAIQCAARLAKVMGKEPQDFKKLKKRINLIFWPQPGGEKFLATWATKFFEEAIHPLRKHYSNYFSFEQYENRCDVLAHLLAILFDLPQKNQKEKILEYLFQKRISDPYPVKVLNPPIFYPNPTWNPKIDLYREIWHQNLPFCYHNAGIWPYVGGFYILTLVKCGKIKKAREELEKLAQANKIGKKYDWEFNEWLHGKTGKPMGAVWQAWSAAGYVIAYKAVKEEKLIF